MKTNERPTTTDDLNDSGKVKDYLPFENVLDLYLHKI